MKKSSALLILSGFVAVAAIGAACNSQHGDDFGGPVGSPTPIPTTFTATLGFVQGAGACSGGGCHAATSPASGLALAGASATVFGNLMTGGVLSGPAGRDINTTNGAASFILAKTLVVTSGGTDGAHPSHPFGSPGDPNYQAILGWINAGALNN